MSDSVRPHRRQPTRLPRPWDSPGKNTGVGCHFLFQCVKVKSLNCVRLVATPWTAAHQSPSPMGFSRQEYWSGVPLPSPIVVSKKHMCDCFNFAQAFSLNFVSCALFHYHIVVTDVFFYKYCRKVRRRQWQAIPVLLPRKSHGWRSLVGCIPWGRYRVGCD